MKKYSNQLKTFCKIYFWYLMFFFIFCTTLIAGTGSLVYYAIILFPKSILAVFVSSIISIGIFVCCVCATVENSKKKKDPWNDYET